MPRIRCHPPHLFEPLRNSSSHPPLPPARYKMRGWEIKKKKGYGKRSSCGEGDKNVFKKIFELRKTSLSIFLFDPGENRDKPPRGVTKITSILNCPDPHPWNANVLFPHSTGLLLNLLPEPCTTAFSLPSPLNPPRCFCGNLLSIVACLFNGGGPIVAVSVSNPGFVTEAEKLAGVGSLCRANTALAVMLRSISRRPDVLDIVIGGFSPLSWLDGTGRGTEGVSV